MNVDVHVVCLQLEEEEGKAEHKHKKTTMNTFSEVLFCFTSWGVNTDFTNLASLARDAPDSLSLSLQDSCFTLAVKFKLA